MAQLLQVHQKLPGPDYLRSCSLSIDLWWQKRDSVPVLSLLFQQSNSNALLLMLTLPEAAEQKTAHVPSLTW